MKGRWKIGITVLIICAVVIAVIIFATGFRHSVSVQKQLQPIPTITQQQVTISGRMVCLPHKDQSGPQTLECAFGILDDKGNYYALHDTDSTYKNIAGVGTGTKVVVAGKFTPQLGDKYQSIGVIDVTSITKQ